MPLTAPLLVDSKDQLEEVKYSLAAAFGDHHASRDREINVDMPDVVCQSKALTRTAGDRSQVGPVTLFKDDSPFAIVHFRVDREANEYSYSLGGHAGWHKRGTEETISKYFEAVETTFRHLGVLPEQYQVTCPCGTEDIVDGAYTAVSRFFNEHQNSGSHADSRVLINTLINREVSPVTSSETNSEAKYLADQHA